jgi:hypothetical protein
MASTQEAQDERQRQNAPELALMKERKMPLSSSTVTPIFRRTKSPGQNRIFRASAMMVFLKVEFDMHVL